MDSWILLNVSHNNIILFIRKPYKVVPNILHPQFFIDIYILYLFSKAEFYLFFNAETGRRREFFFEKF